MRPKKKLFYDYYPGEYTNDEFSKYWGV